MQKEGDTGTNHGKEIKASQSTQHAWRSEAVIWITVSSWAVKHLAQLVNGPTLYESWNKEGV
jgi:hypothetical protein